MKYIANIVCAV